MLTASLTACVQQAPPDLVESIESIERQLTDVNGAQFAPDEYLRFVKHWVGLKERLIGDEDLIRWPWEPNQLVADLQQVQAEGEQALAESVQRRDAQRLQAETRLATVEQRFRQFNGHVHIMGSRVVLGKKPLETELLVRQARSFFNQGLFSRSDYAGTRAARMMDDQAMILTNELGHYADERKVELWRQMVARTVGWSKRHHAAAIIISKADRRLMLYRNGGRVLTYPVRLGAHGILEKRHQDDGATPEGHYRVIRKRGHGQTPFYPALLLDYPNDADRRRYEEARRLRTIPDHAGLGAGIEIHGVDDDLSIATLGSIMLDNDQIDALFERVEVGTPVTIVGAIRRTNSIALALAELETSEEG